jgi:hypothetical protein
MDKKIRLVIILTSAVIFMVAGAYLFLYSQGIRVDFAKWRLVKTGGFDVQVTSPSGADIYLNNKKKKTTSFLSSSVFIKNLLPRTYKVEIKKDGYLSWQKNLLVEEGLVTKIKNIVLFKQNADFENVAQGIENFWVSRNGQRILVQSKLNQSWGFSLIEASSKKMPTVLFDQSSLKEKGITPLLQDWQDENRRILFHASTSLEDKIWIVQYDNPEKPEIPILPIEKEVAKIAFLANDASQVVYLKANNLYTLDFKEKVPPRKLIANKVLWFDVTQDNLYYLTQNGFIVKAASNPQDKGDILNQTPIEVSGGSQFKIYDNAGSLLLHFNQGLYYLTDKELTKLTQVIQGLDNSLSSTNFCFWGNQEIWLFDNGQSEKNPKFLNRFWKSPNNVFWLNSDYLVFNIGDEIKITELDERDYLNIVTIKTFKEPKIYFNHSDKKLYVLSEKTLYSSERLLP